MGKNGKTYKNKTYMKDSWQKQYHTVSNKVQIVQYAMLR